MMNKDIISENISLIFNLKNYILPIFDIDSNADDESVSDIFVHVNSGGVPLKQNDSFYLLGRRM